MEKSIFNFKILYKDGSMIDLQEDKNLWVSSFRIHSPSFETAIETIEGRHGEILLAKRLTGRKITTHYQIEAVDEKDFDLFRDEIYSIFNPLQEFYIIRDLQQGKRIKVSVANNFDIDYITLEDGEFSVEFIIHSVFIESVNKIEYPFNTNFSFNNIGNVLIDMREQSETEIEFKGASTNLVIKNLTTGDEWKYTGSTTSNDLILLKGIRSTKNGLSIIKNTNKRIITFAPGWNDFEILGATNYTLTIKTRFYFI